VFQVPHKSEAGSSIGRATWITVNEKVTGTNDGSDDCHIVGPGSIQYGKKTSATTGHSKPICDAEYYNITLGKNSKPQDYLLNLTGDPGSDFDLLIWDSKGDHVLAIAALTYPDIGYLNNTAGDFIIILILWSGSGSFHFVVSPIGTTDRILLNFPISYVMVFSCVTIVIFAKRIGREKELEKNAQNRN
jgi:hypothetical protein